MTEPLEQTSRFAADLGVQVRLMREQRGWTQAQLALVAGMSQPAVARFEAAGTVPTIPVVERLANALDAELTVLLTPKVEQSAANTAANEAEDAGRLVQVLRMERNWSPAQLAAAAGVSEAEVLSFEAGHFMPAKPMMEHLLRAMGVDI